MKKTILFAMMFFAAGPAYGQRLITVDFPLVPRAATVDSKRILDLSLNQSSVNEPWEETLGHTFMPLPEVGYLTPKTRVKMVAQIFSAKDDGLSRRGAFGHVRIDRTIRRIFFAGDAFIGKETAFTIPVGDEFESQFTRFSYGGRGWFGARLGRLNGNFMVVKYGWGYVSTEGRQKFSHPNIDSGLEAFELYEEEFSTRTLGLDAGLNIGRVRFFLEGEKTRYRRYLDSPDPFRYGLNRFSDTKVKLDFEVLPLKRTDQIQLVTRVSKTFGKNDSILFFNNYPGVQVFVRIAIK